MLQPTAPPDPVQARARPSGFAGRCALGIRWRSAPGRPRCPWGAREGEQSRVTPAAAPQDSAPGLQALRRYPGPPSSTAATQAAPLYAAGGVAQHRRGGCKDPEAELLRRQRIREAMQGQTPWNVGKPHRPGGCSVDAAWYAGGSQCAGGWAQLWGCGMAGLHSARAALQSPSCRHCLLRPFLLQPVSQRDWDCAAHALLLRRLSCSLYCRDDREDQGGHQGGHAAAGSAGQHAAGLPDPQVPAHERHQGVGARRGSQAAGWGACPPPAAPCHKPG